MQIAHSGYLSKGIMMHIGKIITVAAAVAGFCSAAMADTYQWVDDKGGVHFTDDPDRIPARYQKRVREIPSPRATSPSDDGVLQNQDTGLESNLPGGLSEEEWRSRFAAIRTEMKDLREGLPKKQDELNQLRRMRIIHQRVQDRTSYAERKAAIDRDETRIKELEAQLSALEIEASRVGVPMEWRQ